MDLNQRYQPGIRKNSFYELQNTEESMSTEESRRLFGQGTIVVKTQKSDPYDGNWIGLGDIKVNPKSL